VNLRTMQALFWEVCAVKGEKGQQCQGECGSVWWHTCCTVSGGGVIAQRALGKEVTTASVE
jgi:hypothetical protein